MLFFELLAVPVLVELVPYFENKFVFIDSVSMNEPPFWILVWVYLASERLSWWATLLMFLLSRSGMWSFSFNVDPLLLLQWPDDILDRLLKCRVCGWRAPFWVTPVVFIFLLPKTWFLFLNEIFPLWSYSTWALPETCYYVVEPIWLFDDVDLGAFLLRAPI